MANNSDQPAEAQVMVPAYTQEEEHSPLSDILSEVPSYATRGLLYVVLLFLASALAWSSFTQIDIFISVQAMLIPEGKAKLIQPPLSGIVEQIYIREGETVTRGQALIALDSEEVSKSLSEVRATENALALAQKELQETVPQKIAKITHDIAAEQENFRLDTDIHRIALQKLQEQRIRYDLELQNALSSLAFFKKEVEVNQRLKKLGLIADLKLLEVLRSQEEASAHIARIQSMQRDVTQERMLLEKNAQMRQTQHEVRLRELQEQLVQLRREAEEAYDLAKFRYEQAKDLARLNLRGVSQDAITQAAQGAGEPTNRNVIVAPEAGIISEVLVRNSGEAVTRGQTVMSLLPKGASLVAELQIPNKDIGTAQLGLPVNFKFDAFPYTEHGVITGKVVYIAPEAQRGEGEFYRALASLQQTYFRVEGERVDLRPGMTAAAEIVTARKTILELLFKPLTEFFTPEKALP